MNPKITLVLGASLNPARYSNLAVKRLRMYQHPVFAVGRRNGMIDDVIIETEKKEFENIDTITFYLNQFHQQAYYDYVILLKPRRLIFNPGAENPELVSIAADHTIETIEACTLVLLSTGQY